MAQLSVALVAGDENLYKGSSTISIRPEKKTTNGFN